VHASDGQGDGATRTFPEATSTDREFQEAARDLLRKAHTRRASLHRVGLILSGITLDRSGQPGLFDGEDALRWRRLDRCVDSVRDRFGYAAIVAGGAIDLLPHLRSDSHGYILRTPSLTK
jgi:hypothetical protein